MRNWLGGFLFLWCMAWAGVAQAGILQAEVLEDPSADLSFNQVTEGDHSGTFKPMGDTLARGYSSSAFWVRLVLAAHQERLYLRVRPPYLDHVTLYRPDAAEPNGWAVLQNGDRVAMKDRRVWGVSLLFVLPPSEKDQTVYLRLQTQSSSLMNFDVLTLPEFQQQEFHTMLLQLLLIAVMMGILIWAALDYVVNRQRIVGVFLLVQLAQVGYVLAVGGYLPLFFSSAVTGDLMTSVLVVITVFVTLLFHRLLVAEFEPSRWGLWLLNLMMAATVLAFVAVLLGHLQFGLSLNSYMVLLLMPVLLWLAFSATRDRLPGLIALRLTYVVLAIVLFFVMAPIFGIWVSFDVYVWTTTTQGLLTGLIMAAFLFRRSMATQAQFVQDQLQLARVQEKLTSEQQRVADQRQFLDMLAHELKTPLGVIQLTLDSVQLPMAQQRRLHRSLDTMSAVIDRCRLSLQLDEGRLTPKLEAVEISAAVYDLVLACKDPDRVTFTGEGPSLVRTDRQLFLVILHNLLDNSVKYSPADSMVTVSTQVCDGAGEGGGEGMCVIVHNRLTRRPAATPETLFEKYFRGINATGQTGSGLGLHLSRRLATIINGQLWAELGSDDIKLCLWIPN